MKPTTWLLAGLDRRVDTEGGQALFRALAAAVVTLFACALCAFNAPGCRTILAFSVLYLVFGVAWIRVVAMNRWSPQSRQWAALVLDQVIINGALAVGGTDFAALLWAGVMASIGHGLRFGLTRGISSALLGGVLATCAVLASPSLRALPMMSVNLVLTSTLLPIYAVRLAKRMSEAHDRAEARAHAMERLARHDPLTGLPNRISLESAMNLLREAAPSSHAALAFVDLDAFKAVNDQMGHEAGDGVLCQVAERLRHTVRETDTVVRLGGDEFAILITSQTAPVNLEELARRLAESVREIHPPGRPDLSVHASIGMWRFRTDAALKDVLREADALMYRCKKSGMGQFELGGELTP